MKKREELEEGAQKALKECYEKADGGSVSVATSRSKGIMEVISLSEMPQGRYTQLLHNKYLFLCSLLDPEDRKRSYVFVASTPTVIRQVTVYNRSVVFEKFIEFKEMTDEALLESTKGILCILDAFGRNRRCEANKAEDAHHDLAYAIANAVP